MAKLTLNDLANLQNEATTISTLASNNTLIETALENTLSRDGTSPNTMTADIDMNSHHILNLPLATNPTDPVRLQEVGDAPAYAAATLADRVLADADVVLTHADVVLTHADAVATAADRVQTGLDVVSTGASASAASASAQVALTSQGFKYTWLSATTNSDPTSGNIKFNNATIGSVTSIYMSETDSNANNLALLIADWGASTSTTKAIITIQKGSAPGTVWADFYVTAVVTDNGTWDTLTVTYKAGPGGFANNDAVYIKADLVGDKGATGATGAVGASGTPTVGQLGVWTNATTLKGVSVTGLVKGNGSSDPTAAAAGTDYLAPAAIGTTVQAYDAATLKSNASATITTGYGITPYSGGTIASGTYTPNPANGNYQYYTNNGAHVLANPSVDCAIDILVTNGASAGAITFTTFTVSASVGDALTTTNTNKFIISIRRINSISTYMIKALQ